MVLLKTRLHIAVIRIVSCEAPGSQQEPLGPTDLRVKGGIQTVILTVQPDNVPGMVCGSVPVGIPGHQTGIHPQLQCQPVKEHRIALADSGFVHQRRIGRVFQHMGAVVQIVIVVGDAADHVVVDASDLFIIAHILQIQIPQQLRNRAVQLLLLSRCGVVFHRIGYGQPKIVFSAAVLDIRDRDPSVLPSQVITLLRISGMGQRGLKQAQHQLPDALLVQHHTRRLHIDGEILRAVFQIPPQLLHRLLLRQVLRLGQRGKAGFFRCLPLRSKH